jgi:hypothetical protein
MSNAVLLLSIPNSTLIIKNEYALSYLIKSSKEVENAVFREVKSAQRGKGINQCGNSKVV